MKFIEIWDIAWERSVKEGKTNIRSKILRFFGVLMAKMLLCTPLTANMVSFFGVLSIIVASALFAVGQFWWGIAAIILLYVGEVFDYADGTVARCRKTSTKMQADLICRMYHPGALGFIFAGVGIGIYLNTGNYIYLILGMLSALFQQTTIYLFELKNAVLLNYNKEQSFETIRGSFINSKLKRVLAYLFGFPIDWLYSIIFVVLILNQLIINKLSLNLNLLSYLLVAYTAYLLIRMLLTTYLTYSKVKNIEITKQHSSEIKLDTKPEIKL